MGVVDGVCVLVDDAGADIFGELWLVLESWFGGYG